MVALEGTYARWLLHQRMDATVDPNYVWTKPSTEPPGTYPLELVVKVRDTGAQAITDTSFADASVEAPSGELYPVDVEASSYDEPECPQNYEQEDSALYPGTSATNCLTFDYPKTAAVNGAHLLWSSGLNAGPVYKWVL